MGGGLMTDLSRLQPLVSQVSAGLARKFRSMERDDIENEAWAWLEQNRYRLPALLEKPGLLVSFLAKDVRTSLLRKGHGGGLDLSHIYSDREMGAFLGAVLGPDRGKILPEWEPVARLVERALEGLSEEDQEVLTLRHRDGLEGQALANAVGITKAAATRRANRALSRLQVEFERTEEVKGEVEYDEAKDLMEERPDGIESDPEYGYSGFRHGGGYPKYKEKEDGSWSDRYVGSRVVMNNAQAQAVISGDDNIREPASRLGGMRNIDE
jgi:sigma-70-like protein